MRTNERKGAICLMVMICIAGSWGAIMGIDYGTEWIKMSQIRSRSADIIENEHSGRKTPGAFTFKDQIIIYGSDAKNLATKQPEQVFKEMWPLLGRAFEDSEGVSNNAAFYAFPFEEMNGTLGVKVEGLNGTVPLENAVGIVMRYLRELAVRATNQNARDCVITVPPFWKHHERQAVLDAAKIGGLNVLSLLNQPTAIAINFALSRSKDISNDTNVIFFDIGASTTTVSLVSLRANSTGKETKPMTTIHVVDFVWKENLGGRYFDLKIAEFIAADAQKKSGEDVRNNKKAWTKILKEAQKTKEVLSANQETHIGIEGLLGDFDYRGKITRQQFEEMSADLLSQFVPLIDKLLIDNSISKDKIQFIETFGGGIRIPKLQQLVVEYLGRDLDKHINGDEGAVMGAAWFAALQSPLYRVTGFKTKDIFPFDIQASISSPSAKFDRKEEIIPVGVKYGFRKTVSLSADENFEVDVEYGSNGKSTSNPRKHIGKWAVDVSPASKYANHENGTVNLSFRLSPSGIFEFEKAELEVTIVTLPPPSNSSDSESTSNSTSAETTSEESTPSPSSDSSQETTEETKEKETETKKEKKGKKENKVAGPITKIHRIPLIISPLKVVGLVSSQFRDAENALENLNEIVRRKKEKEYEKSSLESYIYEMKEKISSDPEYEKFTNETQREQFLEELTKAGDWLYEEGENTDIETYKEKSRHLKSFGNRIKERMEEAVSRPQMLLKVFKAVNSTKTSLANITNKREVTQEEVDDFYTQCAELKEWIQKKLEEQELLALHEEPIVSTSSIWGRWQSIEYKAKALLRRSLKKDDKKKKKKLPKNIKIDNPDYADFINFGNDDDDEDSTESVDYEEILRKHGKFPKTEESTSSSTEDEAQTNGSADSTASSEGQSIPEPTPSSEESPKEATPEPSQEDQRDEL